MVSLLTVATATRASSHKDLPPSVEHAYYRKCIELRRRIKEIEENNDHHRLRVSRVNRSITKLRLERAFLLEQLRKHMDFNIDDSDRSTSPPPTPTDKPLRSKRAQKQKTPPAGTPAGPSGTQQASPGTVQQTSMFHAVNPMSSAQSTPDPSRSVPFFSTIPASSPYPANGAGLGTLPPLHPSQLGASPNQAQITPEPPRTGYYDPTHEDQKPPHNDSEYGGRARTLSSANIAASETREGQNGERRDQDTEMGDAK